MSSETTIRVAPSTGGATRIPYARPFWDDDERTALSDVLESGMWTNGPAVATFEAELAIHAAAPHAISVANGTAALWCVFHALRERHEATMPLLVTTPINFAAAPAAAQLCGFAVAFTDVGSQLEMDPDDLASVLDEHAGQHDLVVVCPMHYAGLSVDMQRIDAVASQYGAVVVEDACHAIGGTYSDTCAPIGTRTTSAAGVFSFHPTKNVAAGEGGAIVTHDTDLGQRIRSLRNHNMRRTGAFTGTAAHERDGSPRPWYYEIDVPGVNLRLSDFHAAIATCQLRRLPAVVERRRSIADRYWSAMHDLRCVQPVSRSAARDDHAFHLFAVRFDLAALDMTLTQVFETFRGAGIDLQVHYTPLYRQPAFRDGALVVGRTFPMADSLASGLCSLPMHFGLSDEEQERVVDALQLLETRL